VEVLTQKAKEGVTVWVMCDFIANLFTPKKMFQLLVDAGGKVVRVKPYFTHYRGHRKIVTIDQKVAYIGGMNIGKQYANMDKKKNPWRDTQIRLEGASASVLNTYFLKDWLCSIKRSGWQDTISYLRKLEPEQYETTSDLCQFIVGGVDTNKEAVTNYYSGQLLEYGTKVYKYHGYIHAKTMIIDDELCCVGSVNMDMRSLMVDDEVCGVFYENQLVERYNQIYDKDITDTTPYTWEEFQNRGRKERFMESIFFLFAPLM